MLQLSAGALILVVLAGCGKNETVGGALGATTGAVMGAAVAGRHNQGTGMLVGALLGGLVGGSAGRAGDQDEERRDRVREQSTYNQRMAHLKEENRQLQRTYTKWCEKCTRSESSPQVRFCAYCPQARLIYEKRCPECHERFSGDSQRKYCQNDGAQLKCY